jgi:hypothetical protein
MRQKHYQETFTPKGYLEIYKLFPDGTQEVVLNDHNVITSGLGVTMSRLFSEESPGTRVVDDYRIGYLQLGLSGDNEPFTSMGSGIGALGASLTASQYGSTTLDVRTHNVWASGTLQAGEAFLVVPESMIGRPAEDRVVYQLVLDESTANDLSTPLNEIGLFSKNPFGTSTHGSILCAYRAFSNITKSSAFSLVIRWTLEF